jgi:hypothetical protein
MAEQHPSIVGINELTIGYHLSRSLSYEPGYRAEDLELGTLHALQGGGGTGSSLRKCADVWLPGLRRLLNDRLLAHLEREVGLAAASDALLLVKEPN